MTNEIGRRHFLQIGAAATAAGLALSTQSGTAEAKISRFGKTLNALKSAPEFAVNSYVRLESSAIQAFRRGKYLEQLKQLEAAKFQPDNEHFQRGWDRTDKPVKEGLVSRTWMWGPAFSNEIQEDYIEGENPPGKRTVQYFDKSRMEITHPNASDPNSIWYVTNGLLVNELTSGAMQMGDTLPEHYIYKGPAEINVAGDQDDTNGPTYKTFQRLTGYELQPDTLYTKRVDRAGNVTNDPSLASYNIQSG